jgi:hypothetical protein
MLFVWYKRNDQDFLAYDPFSETVCHRTSGVSGNFIESPTGRKFTELDF